jgi:hypothetical protein
MRMRVGPRHRGSTMIGTARAHRRGLYVETMMLASMAYGQRVGVQYPGKVDRRRS